MNYIEAEPKPVACQKCEESGIVRDCGTCDNAGDRWYLSRKDELLLKRKSLLKAIERYERQIDAIDRELEGLNNG